jgi:uncharacterized membrane protein
MTWPQIHQILVYTTVVTLPLGFLLLFAGALRHRHRLRRFGLGLLLAASLVGLLAFAAGGHAKLALLEAGGVRVDRIQHHQQGAEAARIALIVLGAASIAVLLVRDNSAAHPWLTGGLVIFALVATLLLFRAALLGRAILHSPPDAGAPVGAPPS